jgi:arylsulfatase A-like enzyme
MQVQLHGGKLRGASLAQYEKLDEQVKDIFGNVTDPDSVTLPPYYPRDPVLLKDWSTYLDTVRITDRHVGLVMKRLKEERLLDNTLIVFFTDHGISHARGKQFLYDEGTRIPLIIRGAGAQSGTVRTDLVEHIDIAATSLAAAGIEIPAAMQGQDILDRNYQTKQVVFAARDRCGEAADRIRSVRTDRYLYIRHFYPQRPHLMPNTYKDSKLIIQRLRELHAEDALGLLSEKLLFAPTREPEELYLYNEDPWQTENLAEAPDHADALARHRQHLNEWIEATGDPGSETPEVYRLETEDQIKSTRNKASREAYRKNVDLYKCWAREGK